MIIVHELNSKARIMWSFRSSLYDSSIYIPDIPPGMEEWLGNADSTKWIWDRSYDDNAVVYKVGVFLDLEDLVVLKLKFKL